MDLRRNTGDERRRTHDVNTAGSRTVCRVRRLLHLDLPEIYGADILFPWMSEAADLNRGKNFFETNVAEYQTGGSLDW